MERLLWRLSEVSEATGISRPELYLLIRRGRLRAVYVGRAVRIPAAELDRLVKYGIPAERVAD